jgi:hypothetical protein
VAQTLQAFLKHSLLGTLSWTHQLKQDAHGIWDAFSASRQGMEIQLRGFRPMFQHGIPDVVHHWVVTLTWHTGAGQAAGKRLTETKQRRRTIDGKQLNLPETVSATTPVEENTLAKLFRVAYEHVFSKLNAFVPLIEALTQRLRAKTVAFSSTHIKPDFRYGLMGGKLIQVGSGAPWLEIFQTGQASPAVTLYPEKGQPVKLGNQWQHNTAMKHAIETLLAAIQKQQGQ